MKLAVVRPDVVRNLIKARLASVSSIFNRNWADAATRFPLLSPVGSGFDCVNGIAVLFDGNPNERERCKSQHGGKRGGNPVGGQKRHNPHPERARLRSYRVGHQIDLLGHRRLPVGLGHPAPLNLAVPPAFPSPPAGMAYPYAISARAGHGRRIHPSPTPSARCARKLRTAHRNAAPLSRIASWSERSRARLN
jgi:hypothetical protein